MSDSRNRELAAYWGKAGDGSDWHPLIYHQLDVSATGVTFLELIPGVERSLVDLSSMTPEVLRAWLGFFLAIHDLGKFSSAFQHLRRDLGPPVDKAYFYTIRHDTLGYVAWKKLFAYDKGLQSRLASWPDVADDCTELADTWIQCVTGHHGQPPEAKTAPMADHFSLRDQQAVRDWVAIAAELFLPPPPPEMQRSVNELDDRRCVFSWFLAGLSVLADWLGSNRAHFPYHTEPIEPEAYWNEFALPRARRAISQSGLLPVKTAEFRGIPSLFDFITDPTPLQQACLCVPVDRSPRLYILEDVTGAGKTEAAFILVARIMAAGRASGAYIALPTMATANAMYRRTADVYRKLFNSGGNAPSLVLSHGARYLDDQFAASIIDSNALRAEGEYAGGEFNAEARCNSWLADNNKKALLAHIGVGTIDQALLAVLQSRHQSLRLLGLIGKVLIVDEVHASDAYMHVLLCQLLNIHARAGGSAILLSATLPQRMRRELMAAFSGSAISVESDREVMPYPLFTTCDSEGCTHHEVATRDAVQRQLRFRLVHGMDEAIAWVIDQAENGRCIAWVRNTVNDAIETAERLRRELGVDRVTLFHARFAMGDRLAIERAVLDAFGPNSAAGTRTGRVVVATQVIEQSLDLDFDEMISDLAPIDLLIQRAGRLRRHCRDAAGNQLAEGLDQRGEICLHVFGPSAEENPAEGWLKRFLPGTAAVYPDHGQLWLTVREISNRAVLHVPEAVRVVIEGVFSEDAASQVPEALQDSNLRAEGKRASDRSVARLNAIKPAAGYRRTDVQWLDESYAPTRLGDATITVRLGRWENGQLRPWCSDSRHPWPLSEVRIAAHLLSGPRVDDAAIRVAMVAARETWPKASRHLLLLPLSRSEHGWNVHVHDGGGKIRQFRYSRENGLCLQANEGAA